MADGYDRRDIIQDTNAQPTKMGPSAIPLSPVQTPAPSSVSKVGSEMKEIAESLRGIGGSVSKYMKKRQEQNRVDGMMQAAQGKTIEEVRKNGNRYTEEGYTAMQAKVASDTWFNESMASIKESDYALNPQEYQKKLSEQYKSLTDSQATNDYTRDMMSASIETTFPKLVSAQVLANNEYRKTETKDSMRKLYVSTSQTDGVEATKEILAEGSMGLPDKDHAEVITEAFKDTYKNKSNNFEVAFLQTAGAQKRNPKSPLETKQLLDLVGKAESNGNYNAVYQGENESLSSMTLEEVFALQDQHKAEGKYSTAVGKYQIINSTLKELQGELGLTGKEQFNEELQDRLAFALLKKRGLDSYNSGGLTLADFQMNLSKEWAAIPMDTSGLSYYHKDGVNAAQVEPGELVQALASDSDHGSLYDTLAASKLSSDQIADVMKARDTFQSEKSSEFSATRLLAEKDIVTKAPALSDEDLIKSINDAGDAGGYSESWKNNMWTRSQTAKKTAQKEEKKLLKVQQAISLQSVRQLGKEDQETAIDMVTAMAMQKFPDAMNPDSPNFRTAKNAALQGVFDFMYKNGIRDERLTQQMETSTAGDIVDKEGKVKPAAIDAYTTYLQAKKSVNDPLFAPSILSDRTKTLFLLADSYKVQNDESDAEQALATASAYVQKQEASSNTQSAPWWKNSDANKAAYQMVEKTIPSMLNGFYGMSKAQGQMRWEINEESVLAAAQAPGTTDRVRMEAARAWQSLSHWDNQDQARELSLVKATQKVLAGSEYIAGSFVYTGDQDKVADRIGMSGINNAANLVVSRILKEYGPTVWSDFNNTDIYRHSQEWYEKEPGISKFAEGAVDVIGQTIFSPGDTASKTAEKVQQEMSKIPDFNVILNPSGDAMIIAPYMNIDRTRMGQPFILPMSKVKEAAQFINRNNDVGFKKWIEDNRKYLPTYK